MAERYEYLVCQVQSSRVTFVNGAWAGAVEPAGDNHEAALASCAEVWDYLRQAGGDGWELVGAYGLPTSHETLEKLYLRRAY